MDAESILELAHRVSRAAVARMGVWVSPQDFEDVKQTAALHIYQAFLRNPDASRGYYARSGFTGAMNCLASICFRNDTDRKAREVAESGVVQGESAYHEGQAWQEPLSEEEREYITEAIAALPWRKRCASEYVNVLEGLSQGLTQKEIGDQIGKTRWHVGVIRQRLRTALTEIKERQAS